MTVYFAAARSAIMKIAREAIYAAAVDGAGGFPARLGTEAELPELREIRACFVTLKKFGDLRGCIGSVDADRPLAHAVWDKAQAAALEDWRFDPLDPDELDDLTLDVSVLTPAEPIESPLDWEVGRHGIVLEKAGRRALFLPQVAPEQGWDREQTLSALCQKARLAPDDWRSGAKLSRFESVVIHE